MFRHLFALRRRHRSQGCRTLCELVCAGYLLAVHIDDVVLVDNVAALAVIVVDRFAPDGCRRRPTEKAGAGGKGWNGPPVARWIVTELVAVVPATEPVMTVGPPIGTKIIVVAMMIVASHAVAPTTPVTRTIRITLIPIVEAADLVSPTIVDVIDLIPIDVCP